MIEINSKDEVDSSISKKIISNTIYNYLGNLTQIFINFFLTPYIFRKLGAERFGIWAFMFAVTSYFSLLDLGAGGSFTKYLAEYKAKRDTKNINNIINHGLLFYLPLGIIQFIAGYFLIDIIIGFFKIEEVYISETYNVLLFGILAFCIQSTVTPIRSIFEGFQKMGILNYIKIISAIPRAAGIVFVLHYGYGLTGLALNEAAYSIYIGIAYIYYSYKIFPQISFFPKIIEKDVFKKIFTFGYKVQVAKIAYLINFQTDKFLIGYFLNTASIGFYDIGNRVASIARSFPLLMVSAITPAASEVDSTKSKEELWKLYIRASKFLLIFTTPIFIFLAFNNKIILELWLSKSYPPAEMVLLIMCSAYYFNLISGVANVVSIGIGKPEFEMETSIYASLLNILLSIILIIKYELAGCVIATAITFLFYSLFLVYKFHSHYNESLTIFIK
ncbi:MAG: hypothetical protein D6734_12865, partial [Candidatus Schekmanbacteria bacterium]